MYYKTLRMIRNFRPRPHALIRWRRAHEATRDAARVFIAARDGRPMELDKRLRLGKLAGGLEIKGKAFDGCMVSPMEASMMGGHMDCVKVLL